jgi:purine-binding chemotaxis protein CheW
MATTLLKKLDSPGVETGGTARSGGGKFLTFQLADEEFGVAILKVREINKIMDITAVPQMPAYMKGVINLRGKVIPVIDLRLKFGLPEIAHTEQTCIIVVNVGREIGIIVDTVSEVLDIPAENVEPPPALGESAGSSIILGMGKVNDDVKILLDIEQVLNSHELAQLVAAAGASGAPAGQ